jgi:hypothetical protein
MGLVNATNSWQEERYENIYVGSCLENYGMTNSKNYSPKWEIAMEVWPSSASPATSYWSDWNPPETPCPWQPNSSVSTVSTNESQRAVWTAIMLNSSSSRSTTHDEKQITTSNRLRAKVAV